MEPPKLDLTDEQRAEIAKEQAKWKARAPVVQPNQRLYVRALQLEKEHRQTGYRDGLAEALATQDRFTEATEVAEREDLREEYRQYAEASTSHCGCDSRDRNDLLTTHVDRIVFDGKKQVTYTRCTQCGTLMKRDPHPELKKQLQREKAAVKRHNLTMTP